ncbi:hypothetical protein QOU29_14755 [Pseudomonas aeruginosa]|nr:hypothetical protein [Pseudomonas aeruginosa]
MFTEENEDADVYIEGDDKISKEIKTLEEKHKYKINRRLLKRLLMISRKLEVGPVGVTNDLTKLEEGLKKEKDSKSIFRGEFNKTKKILSKHLADTESKAGFLILPGGRVKIYAAAVNSETFEKQQIAQPMHFKDLVSPRHGEFTHRIQWYILYRTIKDIPFSSFFQIYTGILQYTELWDVFFDRTDIASDHRATSGYDFRCPELFNDWLRGPDSKAKFPLLSKILSNRFNKRENHSAEDYLANKIHGTDFKKLGEPEKNVISKSIGDMSSYYMYDKKITTYKKEN